MIIVGIVVVSVVIGIVVVMLHKGNKAAPTTSGSTNNTTASNTNFTPGNVKACDAFTLSDARALFGNTTKVDAGSGTGDTTSPNTGQLTSCVYDYGTDSDQTTVTGALTAVEASNLQTGFKTQLNLSGHTTVSGLGDRAYYDTSGNNLKGSYTINVIVSTTNGGSTTYSQAQAEQVAEAVITKL